MSRYEIHDILAQDTKGVVFRATVREDGRPVVLRRFFPFGPDGGGLEGEERAAYQVAVERLKQVQHPALRQVLDGGSDPVDGMPFLVTEWMEGEPLAFHLAYKPLSAASARAVLDQALEASMVLSETLGEEAIWVETSAETIILGSGEENRDLSFWISPLRWLGGEGEREGLAPLLELAEQITGWRGRMLPQGDDPLVGWVQRLRAGPTGWDLATARRALHEAVETPPPASPATPSGLLIPPAGSPTAAAATAAMAGPGAPVVRPPRTLWWPWVLVGLLAIGGVGAFVAMQQKARAAARAPQVADAGGAADTGGAGAKATPLGRGAVPAAESSTADREKPSPASPPEPEPEASPRELTAAEVSAQAAELARQMEEHPWELKSPGFSYPKPNAHLDEIGPTFSRRMGETVEIEAKVYEVRESGSGATRYLEFAPSRSRDAICARYWTRKEAEGMSLDELMQLQGRRLRIRGEIKQDANGRMAIHLESRDQIEDLGD